jgi:hypothetical protein
MIKLLMTNVANDITCTHAGMLVKFLLLSVNVLDQAMHDHLLKNTPLWIKKYNLMGLLNLADMMRSHDPICLHWKIGGRRERVIQNLINYQINASKMGVRCPSQVFAIKSIEPNH